ncbi:GNAT family N-acetyltransferase [Rhodococcus pseudokoreensis]|uniref:GNAT family N-acetyltransferase n=1 Tax=Rhodococcus pseudokoreensis TaxID=2811421 RepID=A0A974W795_9NOCA|nr:GNAT family N-acetyltransferase [Rhodococcus pseudokoreensis]QSE91957.1 GNAT family N-acetyltransferase [Rhodococcus pseudokoreensis]
MRLTNVAHLRLPFGRLLGYDVTVGRPGRPLPVSFDQRRHVGAGDRAGSWMALSFTLSAPVPSDALAAAWLAVIARHGTLRSIFSPGEDGEPRLHEVEIFPGDWVEHPIAPGQAVNDALRDVLDHACPPYSRPSHRLCVLETAAGPTVVVAADHSHVDMWSMLVIARDLLTALAAVQDGRAPSLPPAPAFAEHTRALRDRPSAPAEVHHRWAEVLAASGDVMPRFPLSLGAATLQHERVEVRDVLDVDDSAAFSAQARDDGVSTLALVVAAMTDVTRELAGTPLRAVFPVHSRYDATWNDSVGWFITNSVLESTDPDPRASAEAVKEAVRMGSWPLEDVLRPWGGMPEAPGMFAISWLDLRRLPVRVDATGLEAQYVGATIRTDGVMLWFILDEAGLHLRCRYPDTPEARQHVGTWLDTLVAHLQSRARESVGGRLRLDDRVYRVQRAGRADVPALVALLSDDEIGRTREGAEMARYEEAYDAIARDSAHYLAVVRAEDDRIIGTMQLTIIPGLSRGGTARLQIEGVRVAASERSHGVGTAMLEWAHDHGRHRGATLVQVTTDRARERAQAFYARLGYDSSHVGFKRAL